MPQDDDVKSRWSRRSTRILAFVVVYAILFAIALAVVLRPTAPRGRPGEDVLDGNGRSGMVGWTALGDDGDLRLAPARFDNDASDSEGPGGARSGIEIRRDGGQGSWAYALAALRWPERFFKVGHVYQMQMYVRDLDASGKPVGLLVASGGYLHRPTKTSVYAGYRDRSWHLLTRMFVASAPAGDDTGLYLSLPPAGTLHWQVSRASVRAVDAAVPKRTTGAATTVLSFAGKAGAVADPGQWSYDTGGQTSADLQTYTRNAANAQRDGKGGLVLVARREAAVGTDKIRRAYTSARVITRGKVSVAPGSYVEAQIQAPTPAGIRPSFALIGTSITRVGWPASGELDLLGSSNVVAHLPARSDAEQDLPYADNDGGSLRVATRDGQPHRYGVYFDGKTVRFYVDRQEQLALWAKDATASGRSWPFGAPQYISLTITLSGTDLSAVSFPQQMRVGPISIWSGGVPF
jgi:hypothetical protein